MAKENNKHDEKEAGEVVSDTGKGIKKEMDRHQAKMKSVGEVLQAAGDSTRPEE